ncbi:septum site-determining protein Ssd [Corynebacterium cystitidis]|uniref:septum site-determining protein Ssd n=1 Tax=Corynebacterium cystitidis TaxID=35757 RepID=UPI00211EDE87|nr:septum site-determining protein Ssd [Corynebacterium cystitidis]
MRPTRPTHAPMVVAVEDPTLHPEALHLAAATGRPIVDTCDPATVAQHWSRAHAVIIDAATAAAVNAPPRRDAVYFVTADPATIDYEAALQVHASGVFIVPAQAGELLSAIGKVATADHAAGTGSSSEATVLTVLGAAGGAGTSTFAAALARAAGPTHAPTLVDAHRYSGGLDLVLGIEEQTGARWGEITVGDGDVLRGDIRRALPGTADDIKVLTSTRTTVADPFHITADELEAVLQPLSTSGVTVVDAPAHMIPARSTSVVIVVPAEVRAAAAAARIVAECCAVSLQVGLVLRHRGWSGIAAKELEKIARADVITELSHISRLTRTLETAGLPQRLPRGLASAANKVWKAVGLL